MRAGCRGTMRIPDVDKDDKDPSELCASQKPSALALAHWLCPETEPDVRIRVRSYSCSKEGKEGQ